MTVLCGGYSASWRDEMVVLASFFVVLVFVSSQTGFSVHSRYVIPALPFFFVWISRVGRVFQLRRRTPSGVLVATVVLALTWSAGSSLWVYPHSLSYFNELIGGPRNGGQHLLGSNIDWGQDLLYLKDWLHKHPDVTLDGVAFFGSYAPTLAGIPETPYPPSGNAAEYAGGKSAEARDDCGPKPGWYAVSVNHLYGRRERYRYFLEIEPVASAGYSIYIYHMTLDDANRVRRELDLPELSVDWKHS